MRPGRENGWTPLIEMTLRATWIMATKMRGEMLDAGRGEELDELVAAARALRAEVPDRAVE